MDIRVSQRFITAADRDRVPLIDRAGLEHIRQRIVVAEGTVADTRHAHGDHHARHVPASRERRCVDARHARWDREGCKRVATAKREVTDSRHGVRDRKSRDVGVLIKQKCIVANTGHAWLDDDSADSGVVIKR